MTKSTNDVEEKMIKVISTCYYNAKGITINGSFCELNMHIILAKSNVSSRLVIELQQYTSQLKTDLSNCLNLIFRLIRDSKYSESMVRNSRLSTTGTKQALCLTFGSVKRKI